MARNTVRRRRQKRYAKPDLLWLEAVDEGTGGVTGVVLEDDGIGIVSRSQGGQAFSVVVIPWDDMNALLETQDKRIVSTPSA